MFKRENIGEHFFPNQGWGKRGSQKYLRNVLITCSMFFIFSSNLDIVGHYENLKLTWGVKYTSPFYSVNMNDRACDGTITRHEAVVLAKWEFRLP